jgi:hypothetical protein
MDGRERVAVMRGGATMKTLTGALGVLLVAVALLGAAPALAATVVSLNLHELTERADRIVLGTVLSVSPAAVVRIAGVDVPTVTYRVRVAEVLKGSVPEGDAVGVVEVRMLDGSGARPVSSRHRVIIPGMPALRQGHSYLLLTTRPGRGGLSSTVGLGQGAFLVTGSGEGALARNEVDNVTLFRDLDPEGLPDRGPMSYRKLAERIRRSVEGKGR